jgi:hypothetical protein
VRLALAQGRDGTWPGGMLALPKSDDPAFTGVGTVPAVRRLVEYGWPTDAPPLWQARRPLFRLLAQDDDPRFLYELAPEGGEGPAVAHGRLRLREAAAAALAHLGFEGDPRLRGAAIRIVDRVAAWVKGDPPAAGAPLPETAAPPSVDMLVMLAHMPIFRTERAEDLARLALFLTQPPPPGAVKQRIGRAAVPQPRLVLATRWPTSATPTAGRSRACWRGSRSWPGSDSCAATSRGARCSTACSSCATRRALDRARWAPRR